MIRAQQHRATAPLLQVRGGFLLKGTTLTQWCRENNVKASWAYQALTGRRDGRAARRLAHKLKRAAGVLS